MPCCHLRAMILYTIFLWLCYLPHKGRMGWTYITFYWAFHCIYFTKTNLIQYIHKYPVKQVDIICYLHFHISHSPCAPDWCHTLFKKIVPGVLSRTLLYLGIYSCKEPPRMSNVVTSISSYALMTSVVKSASRDTVGEPSISTSFKYLLFTAIGTRTAIYCPISFFFN